MKTLLKILLAGAFGLVALRLCPLFLLLAMVGTAVALVVGSVLAGSVAAVVTVVLSAAGTAIAVALVGLAVLSPVWVPVLALIGIIALCRRRRVAA